MVNKIGVITDFKNINDKYLLLSLKLEERIEYRAGQYIIVIFSDRLRRSYSISSYNEEDLVITLAVKLDDGEGATSLKHMKIHNRLNFLGPIGNFFYRDNSTIPVFIATGIGITPINSIIEYLSKNNKSDFKLFWGVRDKSDFIFDFSHLGKKFIPVVSKDTDITYNNGHVTDFIQDNLDGVENKDFYICGDPDIVNSIKSYIESNLYVDKESIYTEKF